MKIKQQLFFCLFFSLSSFNHSLVAFELEKFIEEDDPNIVDITPKKESYTPERTLRAFTRSCNASIDGIIELQNILERDIYNFTFPPNQRSLLDQPEFYFYNFCMLPEDICLRWNCFGQAFYNQTSKMNLTRNQTSISAYLAFQNIPDLAEDFDIPLQRLLQLFRNLKVQERRSGIMLGGLRQYDRWLVQFKTPLYYLIRNFFLTDAEKRAIEAEAQSIGFPLFDDNDPDTNIDAEIDRFARRHLIADRIGIGDTRLNAGYIFIDTPHHLLHAGFEATVPTAFAFAKGLYGHHFPKDMPAPSIDLTKILNAVIDDITVAQELGTQFLLDALDRLSRILLETGLGNNGHFGLGWYVHHDLTVAKKLHFKTRGALEYLFPSKEWRFFIKKKDLAAFQAIGEPTPEDCTKQLRFLEEQIVETLFPAGCDTRVFPGFIFKLTTALTGNMAKYWYVTLGHDLWWQQHEDFGKIRATPQEREQLRVDIAKRPPAFMSKLFGNISICWPGKRVDWSLSLYGDRTFLRSGIGKDYNFSIRFEVLL